MSMVPAPPALKGGARTLPRSLMYAEQIRADGKLRYFKPSHQYTKMLTWISATANKPLAESKSGNVFGRTPATPMSAAYPGCGLQHPDRGPGDTLVA